MPLPSLSLLETGRTRVSRGQLVVHDRFRRGGFADLPRRIGREGLSRRRKGTLATFLMSPTRDSRPAPQSNSPGNRFVTYEGGDRNDLTLTVVPEHGLAAASSLFQPAEF